MRRQKDIVAEPVKPHFVPFPEPLPNRNFSITAGQKTRGIKLTITRERKIEDCARVIL